MSKHDIRLRRQKFMARGAERFRNYGAVLERHEKEMRIKKILRAFTYFLIILFVVLLIVIVVRMERRAVKKSTESSTYLDVLYKRKKQGDEVNLKGRGVAPQLEVYQFCFATNTKSLAASSVPKLPKRGSESNFKK